MSAEESDAALMGLGWETWQHLTQTRGLAAAAGTDYDAAAMPSQKAVCYGFYPSIELESMLLISCKKCGLILKDIGYGHHMRSQHGDQMNSGSGDECQSFLLSPPHRVVSPRLDMSLLSPSYRRLSTSIVSPKGSSGQNSILSQTTSTRYSVEQKDDLKLSLRVSRHEVTGESSRQNKPTLLDGAKGEVRINAKVNRRLNGKMKDKKGKKRRQESSDEDNFSLEHFRQKKRLSKKEQNSEEESEPAPSDVHIRRDSTGDDSRSNIGIETAVQDAEVFTEVDRVQAESLEKSASVSLPTDEKQLEIELKSIGSIENVQKEHDEIYENHDEIFESKEHGEAISEQWNEVDFVANSADLLQDVTPCPILKSEKFETQQNWTQNAILSLDDSSNESHPCEDSDPHRYYIPSPPQLSPVAEKDCCMNSVTAPVVTPQEVYHDGHHVEQNLLLQVHERLIPNRYREVVDLSRSSSLHPNEDLGLSDYDAVRHRCVVLEQDDENPNANRSRIQTRYPIAERIVKTGPCMHGYPRGEVLADGRSRCLTHNEESDVRNEFDHKAHGTMDQKIFLAHQQPRFPQLISFASVPQKRNNRTCSSPPAKEFYNSGVSYRDVYIDPEQKIYYPNARLLTVPINGKTTVDYPSQTRSSPPDIFSPEQNHGMHDLPDDVERLPQLPSFHGNMAEDMQREMRNSVQRVVINQDPQHHFDEIDYNLQSERSRLSLGKNAAVKITSESFPEYPYDYDMMTSVNLHGTRSSNYVPHETQKKGFSPRVIRTVRSHVDTMQQPASSQVTPHEVCVPIHGRTVIRPEYRYVYIPSKTSHSTDYDHINNRQRKDRGREMNEYDFSEVRHVEHQSRVQPTIRQVAIQKVQPTVLSRVRTLTTPNVEATRTVKVPINRRLNHHHSSLITEKTVVFHPERKNERSSHPTTSISDVVRVNPKDRMYQACGFTAAGNLQRRANVVSRTKQRTNYTSSYQIQQNTTSRQVRKAKVSPPVDDMESRFGEIIEIIPASSVEDRPNVLHGITVQTAQLHNASFAGIHRGNPRKICVILVPELAKC